MSAVLDVFKTAAAPAAASGAVVLRVQDLKVSYTAGKQILKGISFDVGPEEFVAIIGPSGAGKSTLIRCVNRLVDTTSGSVWFGGQDLLTLDEGAMRAQRRNIGMIFQEFNLIDRLSVIDNVLTGRLGYMGNLRSLFRAYTKADIAQGGGPARPRRPDRPHGQARRRAVRRPAPARGHRPCADPGAEAAAGGRADLGAGPEDLARGDGHDPRHRARVQGAGAVQHPRRGPGAGVLRPHHRPAGRHQEVRRAARPAWTSTRWPTSTRWKCCSRDGRARPGRHAERIAQLDAARRRCALLALPAVRRGRADRRLERRGHRRRRHRLEPHQRRGRAPRRHGASSTSMRRSCCRCGSRRWRRC